MANDDPPNAGRPRGKREPIEEELLRPGNSFHQPLANNPFFKITVDLAGKRGAPRDYKTIEAIYLDAVVPSLRSWDAGDPIQNLEAAVKKVAPQRAVDWLRHEGRRAHGRPNRAHPFVDASGQDVDRLAMIADPSGDSFDHVARSDDRVRVRQALAALAEDPSAPFGPMDSRERAVLRLGAQALIDARYLHEAVGATTQRDKNAWNQVKLKVKQKLAARLADFGIGPDCFG